MPRHRAQGTSLFHFTSHALVQCPACNACARVTLREDAAPQKVRLLCPSCTKLEEKLVRELRIDGPRDIYWGLPLWLQRPCCGHTLWAYNEQHLQFLMSYIASKDRGRDAEGASGLKNKTLASRLPRWMIFAAHRSEVLAALESLRLRLP